MQRNATNISWFSCFYFNFFSLFLLLKCYCIGSVRFIFVGYCWFFVSILFWLLFVTWSTVVGLWSRSFAIAFIPLLQFEMNLFIAIVVTVIGKGYLFIALNMLWKWQSFIFKAQIIFIVFFLLNVISFSCMLCYALCVLRLFFFHSILPSKLSDALKSWNFDCNWKVPPKENEEKKKLTNETEIPFYYWVNC